MDGDDVREQVICPVCLEILNDPRLLPCGHTFCRICLDKLELSSPSSLECPVCRHKVALSIGRANALPKNLGLASISESLRMKNTCSTHGKIMTLFCDDCGKMMCEECLQTHVRHQILGIDIACRNEKEIVDVLLVEAKSIESQVNGKVTNCGRVISMLEKSKNDSEKAIGTYFDWLKEQIDSKKQDMIKQIRHEFASRVGVYREEKSAVSSFQTTLREVRKEYSSISSSDKPSFLKKIRALKERLDESLKNVRELPMDRSYELSAPKCYPCNKNICTFLDDVKIHRVGDSEHCHVCDNKELQERKPNVRELRSKKYIVTNKGEGEVLSRMRSSVPGNRLPREGHGLSRMRSSVPGNLLPLPGNLLPLPDNLLPLPDNLLPLPGNLLPLPGNRLPREGDGLSRMRSSVPGYLLPREGDGLSRMRTSGRNRPSDDSSDQTHQDPLIFRDYTSI